MWEHLKGGSEFEGPSKIEPTVEENSLVALLNYVQICFHSRLILGGYHSSLESSIKMFDREIDAAMLLQLRRTNDTLVRFAALVSLP